MKALGRGLLAEVLGTVLCTGFLGAVYVAGWTTRWAGRVGVRHWGWHAGRAPDRPFPRWRELRANLATGLGVLLHTWVLTGPACLLWAVGWRWGWDASFDKSASAGSGGLLVLLGILWFAAAMSLVPAAQARYAVTGDWRSFYDLPLLLRVARQRWPAWIALSAAHAAIAVPLAAQWIGPALASDAVSTDAEALLWLRRWNLAWAAIGFPTFALLRAAGARWYARAVLDAVREGVLAGPDLHPVERDTLADLGLLRALDAPPAPARRLARAPLRLAAAALVFALFVGSTLPVFTSGFFNGRGAVAFWNQPLVHAPWFAWRPPHLDSR